jgi:peroxiredoxin
MLKNSVATVLLTVLVLSLICSVSLQQSHAEMIIAESADLTTPLRSGEQAPEFVVLDADGDEFFFDPDALERPVVLITFRGGWCPYCNLHLSELRTVVPEIAAMGIDVVFLSGDRPDMLYSSLAADTQEDIADLDYRIYSDADAQAAIALGIAFRVSERLVSGRREKGQDIEGSSIMNHGVLPVPAVYAIDTAGTIRFDFVEPNYKVRLPADELLAVARELAENTQ